MTRPELQAPPEIFYNDTEARKYTTSSRIIGVQNKISERALELLALPDDGVPRFLLDIDTSKDFISGAFKRQRYWRDLAKR
ncbi:hypothetical protein Taro_042239 [Colocasia esculenta]|uniref:Uncharacterized protein n=1 Tax=Colocasia esculenta TaxID=4460 RepID=A0A843WS87_COLES|nr:hypothetical protein [Colocasia esculenta]